MLSELEEFITGHQSEQPSERKLASILFSDIVGSTTIARVEGDRRWNEHLEDFLLLAERSIARNSGILVRTIGDGLLARFDAPDDALQAALALHQVADECGFTLRSGVHTGAIVITASGDLAGIAVHMAARVQSAAEPGEILVTQTVTELLEGGTFTFNDRGERDLKGIQGPRRLFAAHPHAPV